MEALLRVEHLKKQFHRNSDGTYVLKDISFEPKNKEDKQNGTMV